MSTLYLEAAKVLNKINKKKQSIRSILYSERNNGCNIRKLSAIVHGVSAKKKEIENIINKCKIIASRNHKISNYWLLFVLVYEQLFGNLKIQGGGALAKLVRENKEKLLTCLSNEYPYLSKTPEMNNLKTVIPRYLRVNTTITDVKTVLSTIFQQIKKLDKFFENPQDYVWTDDQIDNLLVCKLELAKLLCLDRVPSSNELLKTGKVVLQDKGSCLSAISANISSGDIILDACSAPGSKSLQAIDMLNRNGCLIALDKDINRIKILIQRLREVPYLMGPFIMKYEGIFKKVDYSEINDTDLSNNVGCIFVDQDSIFEQKDNDLFDFSTKKQKPKLLIHVLKLDFLTLNCELKDFKLPWYKFKHNLSKTRVILLDPSCSGSGLPQHNTIQKEQIENRLRSLSEFQTKMLIHSLTMFPSVEVVCYSTCSIFQEENEQVVSNVMENYKSHLKFNFSLDKALENWDNFPFEQNNSINKEIFDKCIFVNPKIHNCRGFFLAKFKRSIS